VFSLGVVVAFDEIEDFSPSVGIVDKATVPGHFGF
jgi:hypothetical protein